MKIAGIILLVVGVLALVYQGFTYTQTKLGSLEIHHQENHDVPIPPVVGIICLVAGVGALTVGAQKL